MSPLTRRLLIVLTAGFLLMTLVKSIYLANEYGGTDLRCRVVGARLLGTHNSPYFYKWKEADGEFYLDPNDRAAHVNGNVVTPATLTVIYPLCQLPYPQIRIYWTLLQILAAAGIFLLLFKSKNIPDGFLVASPMILGFICSEVWEFNIERGQIYIFYTFLFALMYRFYISNWKYNQFISGFIGGLFIFFRPFAAVIGLGFLLHGKKQWIWGGITGFILGLLVFVAPLQPVWKDYFTAMKEYVNNNDASETIKKTNPQKFINGALDFYTMDKSRPQHIEGMDNIRKGKNFYIHPIYPFQTVLGRVGIHINSTQSLIVFAVLVVFLSWCFFRLRKKITAAEPLFLFGFMLCILSEIFTTAPRGGYNIILWIVPISIIYLQNRKNYPVLIVIASAFLLLHNFPFYFSENAELAECLFLFLTAFTIFFPTTLKKMTDGISRT